MCVSFYSPRRAGQRALAPPTDGHPPDFRKPQRQFSHYATAFQPRANHREPQPIHNRPSAARRTIPRLANTHDSTTLRVESDNDFDTTIPHSRFSNLDHQTATQPCKDLLCRKPDSRTDPLCFWNIGTNELPSHGRVRCSKPYSCLPVLHSMVAARLEADIAARSLVGEQAPCQSPRMCH